MRKCILTLLCVWLILPCSVGATGPAVTHVHTDDNGVVWYDATSAYNGPGTTTLRILAPTNPAAGMSPRFIYVLPVYPDVDLQSQFGDGLEELRALNAHNEYNAHIIAPSFKSIPWYADHDSNPHRGYESFMVHDLVPWVRANLSVTGQEEHWLVGFSKSGFGAVTLLFRNPTVFAAAAVWDFPASVPHTNQWDMFENYGTEANFQDNYRLTDNWIAAHRNPFLAAPRLWLSDDFVTHADVPTFRDQVLAFGRSLTANGAQYALTANGTQRVHMWSSGWLSEALAGLQSLSSTHRDGFNRADGGLGANWTVDPMWGNGVAILGGQVAASDGNGSAFYWNSGAIGSDQYSQIAITGDIGVWTGVSVRASAVPSQGYWVVVKSDGAYLYSFVNGFFYQLVHDTTPWATGNVLRAEVRTIAANTARLTVYRNGRVLFTHDDTNHFIADGRPGIGMYASAAMALDNWEGGNVTQQLLPPPPPPAPTNPLMASDDFNRANGDLGSQWMVDPMWGGGAAITGGQVAASGGGGGAYYWNSTAFGADQYSQITITGDIGVWTGVSVRAGATPSQGYWLAVKDDGSYLYALVNGFFHQLVHDTTRWATGDMLRVEVHTIAANTARLTVYRNSSVLFTHDDANHFIADGRPGIGMWASAAMALDNWEGGALVAGP